MMYTSLDEDQSSNSGLNWLWLHFIDKNESFHILRSTLYFFSLLVRVMLISADEAVLALNRDEDRKVSKACFKYEHGHETRRASP